MGYIVVNARVMSIDSFAFCSRTFLQYSYKNPKSNPEKISCEHFCLFYDLTFVPRSQGWTKRYTEFSNKELTTYVVLSSNGPVVGQSDGPRTQWHECRVAHIHALITWRAKTACVTLAFDEIGIRKSEIKAGWRTVNCKWLKIRMEHVQSNL